MPANQTDYDKWTIPVCPQCRALLDWGEGWACQHRVTPDEGVAVEVAPAVERETLEFVRDFKPVSSVSQEAALQRYHDEVRAKAERALRTGRVPGEVRS